MTSQTPSEPAHLDGNSTPLEGAFVETAFTTEQVEAANAEEKRLGLTTEQCIFLAATTTS